MSPEHDAGDGDRVDHAVSPIPQHTTALEIPLGSGTHAKRTVAALIATHTAAKTLRQMIFHVIR